MKTLEFETSKGEFLLVDGHVAKGGIKHEDKIYYYFCDAKKITEEQAKDIVEGYKGYYNTYTEEECGNMTKTALKSLHSLIKSKGIHLFRNTYLDYETLNIDAIEAEQKTFYNPFIYKL